MKRIYCLVVCFCVLGILGYAASAVFAIDAYFDTQISTSLDIETDSGTLVVRMLDEEVPPILSDVTYEQTINVEIIFDASKTMGEPDINGNRKIDIAKKLVSILVQSFPQRDTAFALRVNGAASGNNCLDSALVVPFTKNNGQQILDAVRPIQPTGLSPLSYSLRQVLQDFSGRLGMQIVFIITDGLETCDVGPVDPCTVTMDMLLQADFTGNINILGVNTIYDDAQELLSCFAARGNGEFLDSNRNTGRQLAQLIHESSQLIYSISRILDPETLAEGKILGLRNLRIGDATGLEPASAQDTGQGTDVLIQPGIIQKQATTSQIREIDVTQLPQTDAGYSTHELPPGIYKIEFVTTPVLVSYFTIDQQQDHTIGIVRSGEGFDLYERAHLAMGNRYYDTGQIEKAVEEYQKVLEFDSRNVDAHLNMGIIYQDILQDLEKAAFHYKTYLELQGPRQEEVSRWLREVRGLPSPEEELQQQIQAREEQLAQEAAAQRAAEEQAQRQKERQKALAAYNEILTANPDIVQLAEEDVISGETVAVQVSIETTDSKARTIALDVGERIQRLLGRTPNEIRVYRENNLETPIVRAGYDQSQQRYVIIEDETDAPVPLGPRENGTSPVFPEQEPPAEGEQPE
ncbi:tetratricopeptide repeat protein [candidate division KSB3 bacterium]|uniref:Tetratricopeptide repeat protein n=1 Tax=candidate division KSB3 bacterium TaxID=2044937 RepID=A0A9D5JV42_9BACT|nr:tetratricopeptide repeat protein [candidate division KSB3 bacterium]MBD3324487.1 tetratricopeptide repeat protein [candidate division KSB3 bacterium]